MILTDVDKIMSILEEESPLKVAVLAQRLNTSPKRILNLVNYLEEAGAIKAIYHVFSTTVYFNKEFKKGANIKLKNLNGDVDTSHSQLPKKSKTLDECETIKDQLIGIENNLADESIAWAEISKNTQEFNRLVARANKLGCSKKEDFRDIMLKFHELVPFAKINFLLQSFEKNHSPQTKKQIQTEITKLKKTQDELKLKYNFSPDSTLIPRLTARLQGKTRQHQVMLAELKAKTKTETKKEITKEIKPEPANFFQSKPKEKIKKEVRKIISKPEKSDSSVIKSSSPKKDLKTGNKLTKKESKPPPKEGDFGLSALEELEGESEKKGFFSNIKSMFAKKKKK